MSRTKTDLVAARARIATEGASALLDRGEVTALLFSRVRRPDEEERATRDRIGKRFDSAVEKGIVPQEDAGMFRVGDVVSWARQVYEKTHGDNVFEGLPCSPLSPEKPPTQMIQNVTLGGTLAMGDRATAEVYPANVQECHKTLQQCYGRIRAYEWELDRLAECLRAAEKKLEAHEEELDQHPQRDTATGQWRQRD